MNENIWAEAMKIIDGFNVMQNLIKNDFNDKKVSSSGGASEWQIGNMLIEDIDAVKHHFY